MFGGRLCSRHSLRDGTPTIPYEILYSCCARDGQSLNDEERFVKYSVCIIVSLLEVLM